MYRLALINDKLETRHFGRTYKTFAGACNALRREGKARGMVLRHDGTQSLSPYYYTNAHESIEISC